MSSASSASTDLVWYAKYRTGTGLVELRADAEDTRANDAWLTPAGLELLRAALKTHFDGVERLFFARIAEKDVETLARLF